MTGWMDRFREVRARGDLAGLTGLIPYAGFLGLETLQDATGLVTVLRQRETNIGNTTIPAVHGGVVAALLDHAAFMQLLWETDLVEQPKMINISVDYLRPCLARQDTFARAVLIKQGRFVTNVRVQAWQSDPAKPVAAAHAHFRVG